MVEKILKKILLSMCLILVISKPVRAEEAINENNISGIVISKEAFADTFGVAPSQRGMSRTTEFFSEANITISDIIINEDNISLERKRSIVGTPT